MSYYYYAGWISRFIQHNGAAASAWTQLNAEGEEANLLLTRPSGFFIDCVPVPCDEREYPRNLASGFAAQVGVHYKNQWPQYTFDSIRALGKCFRKRVKN